MAQRPLSPILRYLHRLYGRPEIAELTDRQLLRRFAALGDEEAFALIVRRHGPMILGLCRRLLQNPEDAEDAFQATFLVLARKSSAAGWQDSVANWLYTVALRVTAKMRSQARRHGLEEESDLGCVVDPRETNPASHAMQNELSQYLDNALARLPKKYRAPLILCYLEGKSHKEAAQELGIPAGSVSRHLARGSELLRARLSQNGLCLASEALSTLLVQGIWRAGVAGARIRTIARSISLLSTGSAVATGAISARTILLAEGVVHAMFVAQWKAVSVVLLTIGMLAGGAGGVILESKTGTGSGRGDEFANGPAIVAMADEPAKDKKQEVKPSNTVTSTPAKAVNRESSWNGMQSKLDSPIQLEKQIEKRPLSEVIEHLADRFAPLDILVNESAFKEDLAHDNVMAVEVSLPRAGNVPLRTMLQMLTSQFGATYLVHPTHIEITTPKRTRPADWRITSTSENPVPLAPLVHAEFKETSLKDALRELSQETGISIVLDPGAVESTGKQKVTASLDNVGLDESVRVLADLCDLKAVVMDTLIYVTSVDKADALQAEQARKRATREKGEQKKEAERDAKKKSV